MKLTLRRTEFDEDARVDVRRLPFKYEAAFKEAQYEAFAKAGVLIVFAIETKEAERAGTLFCYICQHGADDFPGGGDALVVAGAVSRKNQGVVRLYRDIHVALFCAARELGCRCVRAEARRKGIVRMLKDEGLHEVATTLQKEVSDEDLIDNE